ncbi:MAG: acyl-CoA dehydrogenase family protein [Acetobacteraceae bacterium]|nr:acyl-CoA dehydrogenase family protein [Acetobacteraceae bacterium]
MGEDHSATGSGGTEDPEALGQLRRTVRGFVARHLAPLEAEVDAADAVDPAVMARLKREAMALGLYGYNMPAELGGPGLSMVAQAVIAEETGRTSMPLGEVFGRLPGSLRFADAAQREWLVGPLMRAETTIAYALTEPDAGSDLNALRTRARRAEGGWVVSGSKQFISHADSADHIIVLAVSDPEAKLTRRFTTLIVPRGAPGLSITRRFRKLGWRGYHLAAFTLEDCFVPDTHVLGEPGRGFEIIMATVNADRVMVAGRCVGIAQAALDLALPWVRERRTFGKALAEHQAIQFALADSDVELEAARLLTEKAARLGDAGDPGFRIAASRAKLYASEMAGRVTDRVLQAFGGAGFMCDLPVERLWRDARGFRIGEGTSEMQRIQIARALLQG